MGKCSRPSNTELSSRSRDPPSDVCLLLGILTYADIQDFSIISKVIMKEQQYVQDLDLIETVRHIPNL